MTSWRFVRDLAFVLAAVLGVALVVVRFVAVPWVVEGPSMAPTLGDGDRVIVDLWTYRKRAPIPGEIALFDGPGGMPLVKRIARESPPGDGSVPDLAPVSALESAYWVAGDNASESMDSRAFGPVPRSRFRGRIVWRYWPPSRAGSIR